MGKMSMIILIFMVSVLMTVCYGEVWTVDSNPGNNAADFTTLQAAHDGAVEGDTLYLSGFNIAYGNLILSKKLYIFGPGYYLSQNDSTQANTYPATLGYVSFEEGSDNSVICGCIIIGVYISVDNITIKRNIIHRHSYWAIHIQDDADYIYIKQNYISSGNNGINLEGSNNNINITNNFIEAHLSYVCINGTVNQTNIVIENNILYSNLTIYNAVISNNILRDGTYTGNASNSIVNNICNGTQFDITGDNQQNVDMNTVFVESGSTDGQWQINPDGPASGTGTFGIDIGMFDGITPYILSGIPEIPTIYYFYGPSNASQALQIQAKIKSRR